MQRPALACFAVALLLLIPSCANRASDRSSADMQVYFSPQGGCTAAVVNAVNGAKETVLVQAYSFSSVPIAKALVSAHERGVNVQVILDKSERTEKYSRATFFKNAGVPTFIDDKHAIAHNKVMVIDSRIVITGSFNFTREAEESNAENLLVIRDSSMAQKYADNWREHLAHSVPYDGPAGE
ncbi:MAG: phospholipase D family protein [Candidatus Brocadiia bacterium]|jgi:phosphatidylserine/phosphatidylglycerophosphate/cardiolipin synthase-like enzyme